MEVNNKIIELLERVKEKNPLVHHITNYVTVNDCANITLAIGASPVMADDIYEVREMVALASSLVINIGTLNSRTVESMIACGKRANTLNIPVILDPVGAGATFYRTEIAKKLLEEVKVGVIRGNLSEIKTLYGLNGQTKGVDSCEEGLVNNELEEVKKIAKDFASKVNTIVAITGTVDVITDGEKLFTVKNGEKIMSKVTGTGCMCTSLIGSYMGAGDDNLLATLGGVVSMGIAGEIAYEKIDRTHGGTGSLKVGILDAIYNLGDKEIINRGKIYEE